MRCIKLMCLEYVILLSMTGSQEKKAREQQIKQSTYQRRKKMEWQKRKNIHKVVLKLFIEVVL